MTIGAQTAARIAAWNTVVPPCAIRVEVKRTHIRYLHPTKGWRRVAKARAGL